MAAESFASPVGDLISTPPVGTLAVAPQPTGGQGLALDPTGHFPASLIKGYPNDSTKVLQGDGNWGAKATSVKVLTGIVTSTGSITAGTGFTISKTGTGAYTINFTVSFSAAPVVVVNAMIGGVYACVTTAGTSSSTLTTNDGGAGGAARDAGFNFLAYTVS